MPPRPSSADAAIRANPKGWIENTVELATAKLEVRSSIPEVSLKLSNPKEIVDEDLAAIVEQELLTVP